MDMVGFLFKRRPHIHTLTEVSKTFLKTSWMIHGPQHNSLEFFQGREYLKTRSATSVFYLFGRLFVYTEQYTNNTQMDLSKHPKGEAF